MTEKQLSGFSRYRFRSDGEVISHHGKQPRILAGGTDKDGYKKFVLIDDLGARRYVRRASLICTAFHGPRPRGMEVRHLDGTRNNDAASNLAWSTHKENIADKMEHDSHQRGDRNGNARLNEPQAIEAKRRLAAGENARQIARDLGVQHSTIYNVKYGKCWAWLSV